MVVNNKTPERTVEEIVEEFEKKFGDENIWKDESGETAFVPIGNLSDWLTQILETERQKREEMVEEIKKQLTRLYDDFYHHGTQEDNSTTFITEKDFDNILQALTQTNNK